MLTKAQWEEIVKIQAQIDRERDEVRRDPHPTESDIKIIHHCTHTPTQFLKSGSLFDIRHRITPNLRQGLI